MKIILEPQESEKYFFNALCNGLGYIESSYGLSLNILNRDYLEAKEKLKHPAFEDVLMQMLRDGKTLTLKDWESGDLYPITLNEVHERVQNTQPNHLMDMVNERDDATTADVILQTVFLKEVIFG